MDLSILENLKIGGVEWAAIIIGLVELAKAQGLTTDKARYLAGGLAAVAVGVNHLLSIYPVYMDVAQPLAQITIVFLVVSGFYQLVKITPTNTGK